MLTLTLSILLAAFGIAVFPCWPYSARWGFGPSVVAGGLLMLVAAFTISGKPSTEDARASRVPAPTPSSLVEIATASPAGSAADYGHP